MEKNASNRKTIKLEKNFQIDVPIKDKKQNLSDFFSATAVFFLQRLFLLLLFGNGKPINPFDANCTCFFSRVNPIT
jgi:hypothetical protein